MLNDLMGGIRGAVDSKYKWNRRPRTLAQQGEGFLLAKTPSSGVERRSQTSREGTSAGGQNANLARPAFPG